MNREIERKLHFAINNMAEKLEGTTLTNLRCTANPTVEEMVKYMKTLDDAIRDLQTNYMLINHLQEKLEKLEPKPKPMRTHTCACGHAWTAEVEMSDTTVNISGEKTQWCPKCGKKPFMSSPYFHLPVNETEVPL